MHRAFPVLLVAAALAAAPASADDAKKPAAESKPAAARPSAAKEPGPVAARAPAAAPRSLEEALRVLARRRTDVTFEGLALDEVVDFLGRLGGVNAMVSPALRRASGAALPAVTLRLRSVTLRQLAELVAKTTGTGLVFRDGVLQFTTPEDARGTPVLRVFQIADLTFRIRNFPAPDITLHTGGVRFVQEEESDQASPFDDPQTVVDLLRKFTGEGTWDDEGVSITADERKLVVKQYPQVLREIAAFLAVLRAAK